MLVTANFDALNGHCIQDIETWDDLDEEIAQEIAGRVLAQQSIVAHGDDAQLLAGVNLALLQRPELYNSATSLLNAALDDSFDRDPIWSTSSRVTPAWQLQEGLRACASQQRAERGKGARA